MRGPSHGDPYSPVQLGAKRARELSMVLSELSATDGIPEGVRAHAAQWAGAIEPQMHRLDVTRLALLLITAAKPMTGLADADRQAVASWVDYLEIQSRA
jgi:hypothetical protein